MMIGKHQTSCTFTTHPIGRWVVTHPKADSWPLPCYLWEAMFSLYEPALERFIRTPGSSQISSMAYQQRPT